jgi:hypothetical protein
VWRTILATGGDGARSRPHDVPISSVSVAGAAAVPGGLRPCERWTAVLARSASPDTVSDLHEHFGPGRKDEVQAGPNRIRPNRSPAPRLSPSFTRQTSASRWIPRSGERRPSAGPRGPPRSARSGCRVIERGEEVALPVGHATRPATGARSHGHRRRSRRWRGSTRGIVDG